MVGVPASVAGESDTAKAETYAAALVNSVATAMPAAALAAALAREGDPGPAEAGALLDGRPDYELAGAQVAKQFQLPAGASAAETAALAALVQVQRLYKLSPNASEIVALQKAGLGSSLAIARVTPQALAAQINLPLARAQQLQQLAESRVNAMLGVIGKFGPHNVGATTPSIPSMGSMASGAEAATSSSFSVLTPFAPARSSSR